MGARCYVACPAYAALRDPAAVRARAAAVAADCGWDLAWSPLLERPAPLPWHDADARRADLRRAAGHDVIWAARGGHGCLHLVEEALALPENVSRPPLLVGYSDVTALHACWRRRGWGETIYGPMAASDLGPRARRSLVAAVTGRPQAWDAELVAEARVLRPGSAEGPCFAACLSVLAALAGTPAMPDLSGCVLVIEDVDERAYRVDRALEQLALAGALDGVAGLVASALPCRDRPPRDPEPAAIVARWGERLAVPTLFGLPCGHDHDPWSLVNGRPLSLRLGDERSWRLAQPAAAAPADRR